MAQEIKTLELCVEQRLYWLIVDDGRRFSASSAEALVSMARGHMGGNPLTLGPSDRVEIRGSLADFAPVLEALQPNVEMTLRLDKSARENSSSDSELPLFDQGNLVNQDPWSWFFVQREGVGVAAQSQWHLVPQRLARKSAQTVLLSSSSDQGDLESSLLLEDSVGLEFGHGPDRLATWGDVRYDVEDATDFARTHLNRARVGLPPTAAEGASCPYCQDNPYPGWTFKIKVAEPVSDEFLGEAMARILEPCRKHRSAPPETISFQGESFYWKAGMGGGLQPHRPAVWERARNRAS